MLLLEVIDLFDTLHARLAINDTQQPLLNTERYAHPDTCTS